MHFRQANVKPFARNRQVNVKPMSSRYHERCGRKKTDVALSRWLCASIHRRAGAGRRWRSPEAGSQEAGSQEPFSHENGS
jgi:hypothetical protein